MRKIYQSSPFNAKKMFSGKHKHIFQISAVRTGVWAYICTYERYAPGNQDLGECYQPRPLARMITLTSTLIIPGITKTSSNNFFIYVTLVNPKFVWFPSQSFFQYVGSGK